MLYIKVNMKIGKSRHKSKRSWILFDEETLMKTAEVYWFGYFRKKANNG